MAAQKKLPGVRRRPQPAMRREEATRLLASLRADARRIAGRFGLTYRDIRAERAGAAHYGICYEDGLIKIRLQHATRGTALKYSSLVHTLCHELAHRKHFDHSEAFQSTFARILEWARRERIYVPGRGRSRPRPTDCGVDAATRREFLEGMRSRLGGAPDERSRSTGQLRLFG